MWAFEDAAVVPDVVAVAKAIANGLPLSAIATRRELQVRWGRSAHGSTYGGNPVACAAALATIDLLKGGLVDNARERGVQAMAGLDQLLRDFSSIVRDVRGRGLMIGIEFDTAEHAEEVQWAAFQRGLLVLECGKSSVRMSPALTVTEAEMTTALDLFCEAVMEVAGEREDKHVLRAAKTAGAITGVEAAG
jgi:4-aminobutyrate aminotransferase